MILDWPKMYKEKLTDAHTALAKIRRGARIFIASACGEPQLLVQTLLDGFTPGFDVLGGPMGEVINDSTSQWTDADRAAIAEFLMAE